MTGRWSIRTQLHALVLAVALPLVALLAYTLFSAAERDTRRAEVTALRLAQMSAEYTRLFLGSTQQLMASLVQRPSVRALDATTCDSILKGFRELNPVFADIGILEVDGRVVCSAMRKPGEEPLSLAQAEWFERVARSDGPIVGKPFIGPITGRWVSVQAYPIRDERGAFAGVLALPLDLLRFPLMSYAMGLPAQPVITIVDDDGVVIARSVEPDKWVGKSVPGVDFVGAALAGPEGQVRGIGLDGRDKIFGFAAIPGTPWHAVVGIPAAELLGPSRQQSLRDATIAALIVLAVAALALRTSASMTRSTRRIAQAATRVARGERETRAPVEGPTEIAELATRFNEMLDARNRADEALRASEERFERLAEGSPVGIFSTDAQGVCVYVNPRWCEIAGMSAQQARGDGWTWALHPEDRERVASEWTRCAAQGVPFRLEYRFIDVSGKTIWLSGQAVAARAADGSVEAYVGTITDISDLKRAETEARLNQERFELAVKGSNDGIWDWDAVTNEVYVSDRYCELVGYTPSEYVPTFATWESHLHPDDRPRVLDQLRRHLEQRAPFDIEYRLRTRSGDYRWLQGRGQAIWDAAGKPIRMAGSLSDISTRKLAEVELRDARDRLRSLSSRLLEVQESERRHIARELHDEIGQAITTIKIELGALRSSAPEALLLHIEQAEQVSDLALKQVRSLTLGLRPPQLDLIGLSAALAWHIDQNVRSAGLEVRFTSDPHLGRLESELETACFRVAQEALTNVMRHANARSIAVELYAAQDELHLIVRDDGDGFDIAAAKERAAHGASVGLLGMEERVALAGGQVTISSAAGQGTEVHAIFPARLAQSKTRTKQRAAGG